MVELNSIIDTLVCVLAVSALSLGIVVVAGLPLLFITIEAVKVFKAWKQKRAKKKTSNQLLKDIDKMALVRTVGVIYMMIIQTITLLHIIGVLV